MIKKQPDCLNLIYNWNYLNKNWDLNIKFRFYNIIKLSAVVLLEDKGPGM